MQRLNDFCSSQTDSAEGKVLAPTGFQAAVSLIMFPCPHNFSVHVHWCWLSQETGHRRCRSPKWYHISCIIWPRSGLVLQRDFVLCCFFFILLIKHDSSTPSGFDQEDWFYACSSSNRLLFHLPIPRAGSPQRSF